MKPIGKIIDTTVVDTTAVTISVAKSLATAVAVIACAAAAAGGPVPVSDPLGLLRAQPTLALGAPALSQSLRREALAPGVTYYTVLRGTSPRAPSWYLSSGVALDAAALARANACFAALGLAPRRTVFHIAGATGTPYHVVAGGAYPSREAAAAVASKAAAAHPACQLVPRDSAAEAGNVNGPWRIDVVALQPEQARGRWSARVAPAADPLRARTSALALAGNALFAINGGFFVEKEQDGYPGQAAGVSLLAGRVNSAPVAGRPAVLIPGPAGGDRQAPSRPVIVDAFQWQTWLDWSNGERTALDGINRPQGRVRNCGRGATDRPLHDHTCHYPDDLVYYPAGSRFAAQAAASVIAGGHFAIAASGAVRELAAGEVPAVTEALVAAGASASRRDAIRRQIARGASASFRLQTDAAGGTSISPGASASASASADANANANAIANGLVGASLVNAGPTLLLKGRPVRRDAQQGWAVDATDDAAHRLLMHDWINRRHPRSALGVRADGTVLLVTVDGRHAASVGLTIEELRQLMASLGAVDAVNLDGGGSTAMAVRGRLVNHPSDAGGERRVGDIIMFSADPN